LLRDGIHGLQVSLQHATWVARLPMIHRDPFDRLLVSQSQIEKMALISADPIFAQYDVELIRC
jgi:PIN domain nuclease of toxin-antitoxin system